MNISKRIFLYNIGVIITLFSVFIAYLLWMVSPLYAEQTLKSYDNDITKLQASYLQPDEADFTPRSGLTHVTIQIPLALENHAYRIKMNWGEIVVDVHNEEFQQKITEILSLLQNDLTTELNDEQIKTIEQKVQDLTDYVQTELNYSNNSTSFSHLFTLSSNFKTPFEESYTILPSSTKMIDDNQFILTSQIRDNSTQNMYSSYLGILKADEQNMLYLTLGTAMVVPFSALQPVVIQSLPALLAVGLFIFLTASWIFSNTLTQPMQKLMHVTHKMRHNNYKPTALQFSAANNEFQQLEGLLNQMYQELQETLASLEIQNQQLNTLNKQQHVFLLASSHQLKTPIASASLLLESMIHKVGKFANTDEYLPKVKTELLTMKSTVEQILELESAFLQKESTENIQVTELIEHTVQAYQQLLHSKNIELSLQLEETTYVSNPFMFQKIVDNLIINAIKYTPQDQEIQIRYHNNIITIENFGVLIEPDILPNIFEPFTRGTNNNIKGHGLGLYIVAQYAQLLHLEITINNKNNSVYTEIKLLP